MPTYNYKARELIAKIVFYGPGRCGKTTNLQQIHAKMRPETRSELLSVATETDRTIYFDLLPLNLGTISGMRFMVRLFTVPGQIYYAETRKLVLRGADGVVFVADSQDHMMDENRESLRDLKTNLAANGLDYNTIPLVLQYNKRDLPRLIPEAELDAVLNDRGVRACMSVASEGSGVVETLRAITVGVFNNIKEGAKTATGQLSPPAAGPAPARARQAPNVGIEPPPGEAGHHTGASGGRGSTGLNALEVARLRAKDVGRLPEFPAQLPHIPVPGPGMAPPFPGYPPQNGPGGGADRSLPPPATLGPDFFMEEFRNLAALNAQLSERMSRIEQEVHRLGIENHEVREYLSRLQQS